MKTFDEMSDMEKRIKRYTDFQQEMKKRIPNKNQKIKLGDSVTIGRNNPKKGKRTYDLWEDSTYYRCVGVNPNIQLQEYDYKDGTDVLGKTITLTDEEVERAKPIQPFFDKDSEVTSWSIEKKIK